MPDYPEALLALCRSVTAKRPKTVIDHIIAFGFITSQELKDIYGYNHPPRAIRDVREHGIPIVMYRVDGTDGRKIAAYRFGEFTTPQYRKHAGRTGFSKQLKAALIEKQGSRCAIYLENIEEHLLQIDHRVPYEREGDTPEDSLSPDNYMLLSSSANRAKSWACEHCINWTTAKERAVCMNCYWAFPEAYSHIAMQEMRRVDLLWQGKEVRDYESLKQIAEEQGKEIPALIKAVLLDEVQRSIGNRPHEDAEEEF